MAAQDPRLSHRPDVHVVVCADEYGCARWYHRGRNAQAVLQELQDAVALRGDDRVQVTTAGCILGCTYGPRFDVVRRWSGGKALYGSIAGPATVTRRGRVQFTAIPDDLPRVVADHLPEHATALADLRGEARPTDVALLRRILLATLANLELVDGSGVPDEQGDIAVLVTEGDGRIALQLSRVRQLEFLYRTLSNGMPSYAIWMRDDNLETVYRIYLRRSDDAATNPLRHELFIALTEKYGDTVTF